MFTPDHVVELLANYGYIILFPIAIVEGPVISIIAGFLISINLLNPFITYPVLVVGDIIGDTLYYALGRYGGKRFVTRWGGRLGITPESLVKAEGILHRHGAKLYIFGKIQGLGSLILITAGVTKMPYPRFIAINTLITLIKTLVLVVIGYYFGYAYATIDGYISKVGIISSFVVMVILIAYYSNKHEKI